MAIFSDIAKIRSLVLPAKIEFLLSILCEQGQLTVTYDNRSHRLSRRSLMVMRPGHLINSYSASPDFKGHLIVVSPKCLSDALPSLTRMLPCIVQFAGNPIIELSDQEMMSQIELRTLLQRKAYAQADHEYRDEVVRRLLEALFYETLGVYAAHSAGMRPVASMRRKDTLLFEFIALVERDFRRHRSVAHYAECLCVSPKHLSAMVKDVSGRTAGDWIDSYVIMEAKNMLNNSGATIQEIASDLSFANQSFFGKYFKHLTGMSPREFRASSTRTADR